MELAILAVNLILGFALAWPVACGLRRLGLSRGRLLHTWALLVGLYFLEGVSMIAGMGIPIFSAALAFAWGPVLWRLFAPGAPADRVVRGAAAVSAYSCLPAASFLIVPAWCALAGRNVLSSTDGAQFGIPDFLGLPWPLTTILGFFGAAAAGAVVLKVTVTTGLAATLAVLRPRAGGVSPAP